MNSFGITDRGKVRRDNQDSFQIERIDEKSCLVAVLCDGMGGEKAGNIASSLAAKAFVTHVRERILTSAVRRPDIGTIMIQAVSAANNMVFGYSCFDAEYTGMGTTLVAAVIFDGRVFIANVGDSRAYKLTRTKITQISHDHSLVQEMVDKGQLSQEEARKHPRRNVITRALGVDETVPCDIFTPKINKGDKLLLCSDGLTNMLTDEELLSTAKTGGDLISIGRQMLDQALDRGAPDNVTVVLISK